MMRMMMMMMIIFGRDLRHLHQIWQSYRSNFGVKYDSKMAAWRRSKPGLHTLIELI